MRVQNEVAKLNSLGTLQITLHDALASMMMSTMSFCRIMNMVNTTWTKLLFLLLSALCFSCFNSRFGPGVNSFNVDVTSKVIHNAPQTSCQDSDCMFGFSVAQHREQGQPW